MLKKRKKTLAIKFETIRDLRTINGGYPVTTQIPESRPPQGSCTSCASICNTCPENGCGTPATCDGCTLWTF